MSVYIKTKEFNVTVKEFRHLLASHYFKQMKFILIIFVILVIINFVFGLISNDYFGAILFGVLLAYYVSIPYIMNIKKTQSKINFTRRFCEIDENFISFIYEDDSLVKIRFDHFIQVTKNLNYFLLYPIKNQFYYLPLESFNTEQELSRFELLMEGKQLLKLW